MAREAVAPGDGALSTCRAFPVREITKSSTSPPSAAIACAPHPAAARLQVGLGQVRQQALQGAQKGPFAERAVHFSQAGLPVPAGHGPKAGKAQGFPRVVPVEVGFAIALPGQSQDGVRTGLDQAVNRPGEMHAQKRQSRVGNRVDQGVHQPAPLGRQGIILAPKGNDL